MASVYPEINDTVSILYVNKSNPFNLVVDETWSSAHDFDYKLMLLGHTSNNLYSVYIYAIKTNATAGFTVSSYAYHDDTYYTDIMGKFFGKKQFNVISWDDTSDIYIKFTNSTSIINFREDTSEAFGSAQLVIDRKADEADDLVYITPASSQLLHCVSSIPSVVYDASMIDTSPTQNSDNLVTSGGIYTSLSDKMDKSNPIGTGSLSINRKANTTVGTNSVAIGENNTAIGDYSTASGWNTIAYGIHSHAENNGVEDSDRFTDTLTGEANATTYTTSSQAYASPGHILKYNNIYAKVIDKTATTLTLDKTLSSNTALSNAEVYVIDSGISYGASSHSEGESVASGIHSHSEGRSTIASGDYSHSEGFANISSGQSSHTEGHYTKAEGDNSHSEGNYTTAKYKNQHVFGEYNKLDYKSSTTAADRGNYVEIVGNGTASNARSNARTLDWSGNEWLAGNLQFKSNSSTYKTTLQPSDLSTASADVTFTLPSDNGTSGQVLATDGSGNTSWQSTVNSLGGSTGAITFGPPLPALSAEFVVNANNQIVRNLHLYQHSVYVTATSLDCSLSFTFISTTSTPINIASALISVINAWLGTSTNGEGLAANGIYKVGAANHQQIVLIKGQGEGATSLKLVMFNSTGTVTEHDLTESAITSVVDKVIIII